MRSLTWLVPLTLLTVPLTACTSGGDDDCLYGAEDVPALAAPLRNPESGQCEDWGGGGGGGGCDWATGADLAPVPDWATCYGYCDSLDETSCLSASGCRAIYASDCPEGSDCFTENFTFAGCWGTAPSGPIEGGGCDGLDAQSCSRHDDCVAHHYPGVCPADAPCDPTQVGNFEACAPEPGDPGDPAGNCYDPAMCAQPAPACPDGTIAGVKNGCWTGYCIPVAQCEPPPSCADTPTEQGCIARADCSPIYQGVDCTCDAAGNCTCSDWVYKSCEDGVSPAF